MATRRRRRRPTIAQARQFAQLIAEHEPRVRRAFMASVTDLQANVDWGALIKSLEVGDVSGAVSALHIDAAAWSEYSSAMTEAYAKSGASTATQIRGAGMGELGIRFNIADPIAESWIIKNVAERVTNIVAEQVNAVRAVIHSGFAAGEHPHTIALDIVGRSVRGGARRGGIIGLDAPRAERYINVTQGMRTAEGVRDLVVAHHDGTYGIRYKVNAATEKRILAAFHAETAVPESQRFISETQYKNALLKARGDTIANTEAANAVMGGRDDAWRQALNKTGANPANVVKRWEHRRGSERHARIQHMEMNGVEVVGLDTPFEMPDGTLMQYAHDPAGGAKHTVQCGCSTEYYLNERV